MSNLTYASLIEGSHSFKSLADISLRLHQLPVGRINTYLIDLIDDDLLDLLAEKFSVEGLDGVLFVKNKQDKKHLIKKSIDLHRHKGTVYAIKSVLDAFGLTGSTIVEGFGGRIHDGTIKHNAVYVHGSPEYWAYYSVELVHPITIEQSNLLKKILKQFAPARCVLHQLIYGEVGNTHEGHINHNGQYTHGTI